MHIVRGLNEERKKEAMELPWLQVEDPPLMSSRVWGSRIWGMISNPNEKLVILNYGFIPKLSGNVGK